MTEPSNSGTEGQQSRPRWYIPLLALDLVWGIGSVVIGLIVATDYLLLGAGVMATGVILIIVAGVAYMLQPLIWKKEAC